MRKKYIILTGVVLIILVCLWIVYNTTWLWRDYLFSPPVKFTENADISLGLYPEGHRSASVFTNSGVSPDISPEGMRTLRFLLRWFGIPGTFFVSPFQSGCGEISNCQSQFLELIKLRNYGFEIAQNNEGRNYISGEPESESIKRGREILLRLEFRIRGYCSSLSLSTRDIEKILDREGYLYECLSSDPPITFRTLIFPVFRGSVIYPFHPEGMKMLKVVSRAEPIARPEKARREFEEIHQRGGVFIFRTELPRVVEDKNLVILEDFLRYISKKDTWLCALEELCSWWLAREKVEITTRREGEIIDIIYDNQTPIEMRNATISFKNLSTGPKMYRVMNLVDEISAEGFIPESGRINVTLSSSPSR